MVCHLVMIQGVRVSTKVIKAIYHWRLGNLDVNVFVHLLDVCSFNSVKEVDNIGGQPFVKI